MTLRFEYPEWLWLAAGGVALALVGLALLWAMHWPRRWLAVLCRAGLMVLLAFALAGATSIRRSDRAGTTVVLDLSGSVRAFVPAAPDAKGQAQSVEAMVRGALAGPLKTHGAEDLFGLIVAGPAPEIVSTPRAVLPLDRPLPAPAREGTDLASALRLALAAAAPNANSRILLISDGNETLGDALAVAQGAGTPIDVLPLRYDLAGEVLIERVEAPTRAAAGSIAPVRVTLVSTAPASGVLRLFVEGVQVRTEPGKDPASDPGQRVALKPGRTTITLNAPLALGRVHRIEALFEPDRDAGGKPAGDTIEVNNRGLAVTTTPGSGAVLLVDGVGNAAADSPGRDLARVLEGQGFAVRVVPPAGVPEDVLSLQAYDLVILQNVSADAIASATQELLVAHVQDFGAGLVMVGGPDSFASGGWRGSALEPILPVTLDLPEKLVVPSTAVVIVMDSSGSMARRVMGSGRSQQAIANAGAASAIKSLDAGDLVGVVRFDNQSEWVVPLGPNKDPAGTQEKILGIMPDGGTNLPPALVLARQALLPVKATVKHIIVLSDGQSQGRDQLAEIAQQLSNDGIKVSSIAVGDDADGESLERLATIGKGEFFMATDPDLLPRIFLRAVRVVRSPMVREEPFVPVLPAGASPIVAGLAGQSIPPLGGLTLTQPKIGADRRTVESVTYAMLTPQGEPVLASWAVGLGQVAAFTSDASRWATQWRQGWAGYGKFWGQFARAIARPPAEQLTDLTLTLESGQLNLRLEALDASGKPIDSLAVAGTVFSPRGDRASITLAQTGPGVYEGSMPAEDAGTYVALVSPRGVGKGASLRPVVGGAVRPPGEEFRRLKSNDALLQEIARTTGGRVLTIPALSAMDARTLLGRDANTPKEARNPLWPWLIPLAIAMLLVDIAARRVAWERLADRARGSAPSVAPSLTIAEAAQRKASTRAIAPPPRTEPSAVVPRAAPRPRAEPASSSTSAPTPTAAAPAEENTLLAAKRRARKELEDR